MVIFSITILHVTIPPIQKQTSGSGLLSAGGILWQVLWMVLVNGTLCIGILQLKVLADVVAAYLLGLA